MSLRLLQEDVLFYQRFLKGQLFYTGELDGLWGRYTERATREFEQATVHLRDDIGAFDLRSEANIMTLTLTAQREARLFLKRVASLYGIKVKILSGTRTYAQQAQLYEQGRSTPGAIVTHARPGESHHNFGVAWDIGIFDSDGKYLTHDEPYNQVAATGLTDTLEWGGHWTTFVDRPHYGLRTNLTLAEIRTRFEEGATLTAIT